MKIRIIMISGWARNQFWGLTARTPLSIPEARNTMYRIQRPELPNRHLTRIPYIQIQLSIEPCLQLSSDSIKTDHTLDGVE